MEISQAGLLRLFLSALLTGVALGAVYDILRALKTLAFAEEVSEKYREIELPLVGVCAYRTKMGAFKKSVYLIYTAVSDILFFVIGAVFSVILAYSENSGRMRWMILVGMVLGFLIYYRTIGKLTGKISALTAFLLRAAAVYVYFCISAPIKALIRIIKNRRNKWKIKKRNKDIHPPASET